MIICQCKLSKLQRVVQIEPLESQKFDDSFSNKPCKYFTTICNCCPCNTILHARNYFTSTNCFCVAEGKMVSVSPASFWKIGPIESW